MAHGAPNLTNEGPRTITDGNGASLAHTLAGYADAVAAMRAAAQLLNITALGV